METTAYIIIVAIGALNVTSLFNDKFDVGPRLVCFFAGLAFISFGVTGLVIR